MSAHDMDRFYASHEAPRPRWGFTARADEPEFEVGEADDFDDSREAREVVDGLNWLGVAVTTVTTLLIGIGIGVWAGAALRPMHKPPAEPTATVAARAEVLVPLRAARSPPMAATPAAVPEPVAPVIRTAVARLEPAQTAPEQPVAVSASVKRHNLPKAEPVVAPAPRIAMAKPAATAKPEAEPVSSIDELLAAAYEAPH